MLTDGQPHTCGRHCHDNGQDKVGGGDADRGRCDAATRHYREVQADLARNGRTKDDDQQRHQDQQRGQQPPAPLEEPVLPELRVARWDSGRQVDQGKPGRHRPQHRKCENTQSPRDFGTPPEILSAGRSGTVVRYGIGLPHEATVDPATRLSHRTRRSPRPGRRHPWRCANERNVFTRTGPAVQSGVHARTGDPTTQEGR